MKVTGTGGVRRAGDSRATPASGGSGFRLAAAGETAAPPQSAGVSAAGAMMGVEALLTLQDVGNPTERKRRAVRRASRILDVLDEVKIALLGGHLSGETLMRLQLAVRDQRTGVEDSRQESLLDEIETRAAVEIAKLERAREEARAA